MGSYALLTLNIFIWINLFTLGQSALVDKDHWVCVLAARKPQNYILPHPDCTKFHVCQYLGGTRHSAKSWKAHIFNCPATTGFDELLKVCNHLYNLKQRSGKCASTPMINVPSATTDSSTISEATPNPVTIKPTNKPTTKKTISRPPVITTEETPATTFSTRSRPVDCKWDVWSSFSPCSASCGTGVTTASRVRLQEAENGGRKCIGKDKKSKSCFSKRCRPAVNCKLSLWSSWSDCIKPCENTVKQSRNRQIVISPTNGGTECDATDETQDCNINPCPVDGTWSEWTNFTECSQTCIGGIQRRTRSCSEPQFGGKQCDGEDAQTLKCPTPEQGSVELESSAEGSGDENGSFEYNEDENDGSGSSNLPQCDVPVCKTTDEKTTSGNGEEYEVPDQNKACVFPFKFEDKEYTKCTNFGCPECFWCGTQYSVSDTEGWGLCNEACPIQEYVEDDASTTTKSDVDTTISSPTTEIITSEIDSGTVTTTPTVEVVTTTTTTLLTTTTSTNPADIVDSDSTENLDVDSLIGRFNIDIRR